MPGYHLNKRHWNTVTVDGSVPERLLRDMVEDSYDLIVSALPEAHAGAARLVRHTGSMTSIEGATVLVTGATDGLGPRRGRGAQPGAARACSCTAATARARTRSPATSARRACTSPTSRRSPRCAALAEELPALDVLVNNAGLISHERVVTEDGCELTLQVNHLSHFLLTRRLLERSAPRRIVHVASGAQVAPDFDDLMLERGYEPWRAYGQSKLAQIMFSNELAERRPDVESTSLHPATFMDTKMVRATIGTPHSTVEEGIEATVRLAAELDLPVSGRYFSGLREATPDPAAADPEARRRLWEASERLTA